MRSRLGVVVLVGSVTLLSGCGTGIFGDVGGTVTPNVVAGAQAFMFNLTDTPVTLSALDEESGPFASLAQAAGLSSSGIIQPLVAGAGQTSATSLKSLKYFIQSIRLCESLELNGTAYNNPKNCMTLYKGPKDNSDLDFYNTYTVTDALADNDPARWIDLMKDQAKLKKPIQVTGDMIGKYKFGMIDFFRPIKATAEFLTPGTTTVAYRTKAVTTAKAMATSGGREREYSMIGDTKSGSAEETVYMMDNGGVWFPFQKDFEITKDDVKNQVAVSMDLVFNPAQFGSAAESGGGCTPGAEPSSGSDGNGTPAIYDANNCVSIQMPFVRMNPVPRKSGQKTYKETYLLDYGTGAATSKVRVELYYVDADENSIMGVDSTVVLNASATEVPGNVIASNYTEQTGTIAASNATVKLLDYQKQATLSGLVRRTNGTATITCRYMGTLCNSSDGSQTVSASYTYSGTTLVSSD